MQHPARLSSDPQICFPRRILRNEKDLVGVWIFHFRARRKSANVHVTLVRRVRAGDETGFACHGNSVGQITFCHARSRRRRCLGRRCFNRLLRWRWRLHRIVRLAGLFCRPRVRIARHHSVPDRRLILGAGNKRKQSQQSQRRWKFHKVHST